MPIKDLIPWNKRGRDVGIHRGPGRSSFLALHREMNRMFERCVSRFRSCSIWIHQAYDGMDGPRSTIDETKEG